MINKVGRCPTRSDNVYFAINEQASLALQASLSLLLRFVLHMPNIN